MTSAEDAVKWFECRIWARTAGGSEPGSLLLRWPVGGRRRWSRVSDQRIKARDSATTSATSAPSSPASFARNAMLAAGNTTPSYRKRRCAQLRVGLAALEHAGAGEAQRLHVVVLDEQVMGVGRSVRMESLIR